MINILLICSSGMSTSMLVKKMQEAAAEGNIEANIWAIGDAESSVNIPKADIVLLGPQVKFLLEKKQKEAKDIPVRVIDMRTYGKMDGKKVLEEALAVLGK